MLVPLAAAGRWSLGGCWKLPLWLNHVPLLLLPGSLAFQQE